MNITNTIIVSVAVALIYVFIIKPRKEKKAAAEANSGQPEKPLPVAEREDLAFSQKELSSLCTIALSLVDMKIYNPMRMMTFMNSTEGIVEEEVYRKMHSITRDFPDAYTVCAGISTPAKRSYAAGFFAAAIQHAEFNANNDGWLVQGWCNCVRSLLHLEDVSIHDFEDYAKKYYDRNNVKDNHHGQDEI